VQEASKLELVRNSALASELTGDQCRVLADAMHVPDRAGGELTNYVFKVHGKY